MSFDKNFRLVCHSCGHKFPKNTAMSRIQDCCAKCDLHIHDLDRACERCSDTGEVPVYAAGLILDHELPYDPMPITALYMVQVVERPKKPLLPPEVTFEKWSGTVKVSPKDLKKMTEEVHQDMADQMVQEALKRVRDSEDAMMLSAIENQEDDE